MFVPKYVAGALLSVLPHRRDDSKDTGSKRITLLENEKPEKSPFNFSGLPPEMQLKIINLLTAKDLLRFERCSKYFQDLANDQFLWFDIGHIMNIDIKNMELQKGKKLICVTLRITHEIGKRNLLPGTTNLLSSLEIQTLQIQKNSKCISGNLLIKFDITVKQFLDNEINKNSSLNELLFEMKVLMVAVGAHILCQNKSPDSYKPSKSSLSSHSYFDKTQNRRVTKKFDEFYVLDNEQIEAISEFDCPELTNFFCKIAPDVNYNSFKPFDIKYLQIFDEMLKNKSQVIDAEIFEAIAKKPYNYLEFLIVILKNNPIFSKSEGHQKSYFGSLTHVLQRLIDEDRKVENVILFLSLLLKNFGKKTCFSFDFFVGRVITENKKRLVQAFLDNKISLSAETFNRALYSSPDFMKLLLSFNNPFPITIGYKNNLQNTPYFYLEQHFEVANILNEAGIKFPKFYLQDAISSCKNLEFLVRLMPLYKGSQDIFTLMLPLSPKESDIEFYIARFKLLVSFGISLSLYIPNLHSPMLSPVQIRLARFYIESGVAIDQRLFKESIHLETSIMAKNLTSLYDDVFFIDIRFPKSYFTHHVHFEIAQEYVNRGFRLPTSYLAQTIKSYDLSKLRKLVPLYLNQSPLEIKIPPDFDKVQTSALAVILEPLLSHGKEIVAYYLNPKGSQEACPYPFKIENPYIQLTQKKKKLNSLLLNSNYLDALLEMHSIPNPERNFVLRDIMKIFFLRENNIDSCNEFMKVLAAKVDEDDLPIILEVLSMAKPEQRDKNQFALKFADYLSAINKSKYKKWLIEWNNKFPDETLQNSEKSKKVMPLLIPD